MANWKMYLVKGHGEGHKVKHVGTDGKGLSQGIHIWNMKALPLTVQKLWPRLILLYMVLQIIKEAFLVFISNYLIL